MKQFTHLYLDDKGLKAIVAPDKWDAYEEYNYYGKKRLKEELQQAIAEGLYLRSNNDHIVKHAEDGFDKHKVYPIPDEYEVQVCVEPHLIGHKSVKYAILVPKENVTPCPKCRTIDFIQTCHDMRCPLRGEEPQLKQQSTIEEAANVFSNGFQLWISLDIVKALREGFIAGAKSDAAKEYWYQQFKQQKS